MATASDRIPRVERAGGSAPFDVRAIREEFPILATKAHGKPLVYLDNAATTQKPRRVIEATGRFYSSCCSNIHRGVYDLSQRATEAFEGAREKVRRHIGAASCREIVFCRGTTEAVNLVAASYGAKNLRPGDEVLITEMEHHSNIVPWQLLAERTGAVLRVAPIDDDGALMFDALCSLVGPRTRIVSVAHVSNALGTVNPVRRIAEVAHRAGAVCLVDGAQAVPHIRVDVTEIDCDFYAFSGHKVYGPTGIGVLYGKQALLDAMPPYQGGGDMIRSVTFERTLYNDLPYKFEAGTPDIAGAIGLGEAIDFVESLPREVVEGHERALLDHATRVIGGIPGVRLVGTAREKSAVLSFTLEGVHPHDIGTILDREGIAVRTGHHCSQPVMKRFGVPATARASFAVYNTTEEIDALARGVEGVKAMFR